MKNTSYSQVNKPNNEERSLNGIKRVPIHKQSNMEYEIPEGYRGYLLQDEPGELDRHLKAGWELVQDPKANTATGDSLGAATLGTAITRVTNRRADASSHKGILIMKRKDWYDEDFQEEQKKVNEQEADIQRTQDDPRFNHGSQYKNTRGSVSTD